MSPVIVRVLIPGLGWALVAGCGPSLDDELKGASGTEAASSSDAGGAPRGAVQNAIYDGPLDGSPVLVCIPADEGCLRLIVDSDPSAGVLDGKWVDADCHPGEGPNLETFDGLHGSGVWMGHGAIGINGEAVFDGVAIDLDVQAQSDESVDGPDCD